MLSIVRAAQITDEMKLAAADALANLIPDSELNEEKRNAIRIRSSRSSSGC